MRTLFSVLGLGLTLAFTTPITSAQTWASGTAENAENQGITKTNIPSVGHFFGIFDDDWKVAWSDRAHEGTPFDLMDYLYIAFAHTYEDPDAPGKYIIGYENARNGDVVEGDADADRIDYLVEVARNKNPNINILISLGWGLGDIAIIHVDPEHYAQSVVEYIRTHKLDGFDLDFEPPNLPAQDAFLNISQELRTALNEASEEDKEERDGKPYLLTISPSTSSGFKNWKELSGLYDLFNLQTYWGNSLVNTFLSAGVPSTKMTVGLLSEGYAADANVGTIDEKIALYEDNNLNGIFAWRLDTDTLVQSTSKPTYGHAKVMAQKIKEAKELNEQS